MPQYVTIKKAAEILGVTPLTLRNWDRAGKLAPYRHPLNNYRLYKLGDLELFMRKTERSRAKNPKVKIVRDL